MRSFVGTLEGRGLTTAEWENRKMTSQIASIIRELEHRRTAIVKALDALAEIDGATTEPATITEPGTGRKGKKRSAATRKRMRDSALARYARLKNEVPF